MTAHWPVLFYTYMFTFYIYWNLFNIVTADNLATQGDKVQRSSDYNIPGAHFTNMN